MFDLFSDTAAAEMENAKTLLILGKSHEEAGEYIQAMEAYTHAAISLKNYAGKNSLDTAIAYNNLGYVYEKMGWLEKAAEAFDQAAACTIRGNHNDVPCAVITGNYDRVTHGKVKEQEREASRSIA
jgi:tetratricopeptide (TPR) repeat protein